MQINDLNGLRQLHVLVSGKVQGVGFRYFVLQLVGEKVITGWVRNLNDGRVEGIFEGKVQDLSSLLEKINRGPSSSQISEVTEKWGLATGGFSKFQIAATASQAQSNGE
jgi:acylphosphatase